MADQTTTITTSVPQTNSQSTQNNDMDIVQAYKHFITGGATQNDNEPGQNVGIDDIRATISISITGTKTKSLITSLNINPITTTAPPATTNTTTPVQKVQESRCHAFYRIIGFPVISSDLSSYYSPGFDIIKQVDSNGNVIARNITLTTKIDIANNANPDFEKISQAREAYAAGVASIFANPISVEAGVLALTSGTYGQKGQINIRPFSTPFLKSQQNPDPFDYSIADQAYSIPGNILSEYSFVGKSPVLLANYQDNNGVFPNPSAGNYKVLVQHEHIINPFQVDPRIDFSTWSNDSGTSTGTCKRIAVPFVPDATFLKASATCTVIRPLIEKVIRARMDQLANATDTGILGSQYIEYVKNIKSIQTIQIGNTPISNIFSNSLFNSSQQLALADTISNVQNMITKLVEAIGKVHEIQNKYYWLPIPSTSGPEGGCSVRPVPINQNVSTTLLTPNDVNIVLNKLQVFFSNLNSSISKSTATPDKGGINPGSFKTFDSTSSDSQGNLSAKTMDNLSNKRAKDLDDAGMALQIIEMIMGEFSGFGLCDVVAINSSLYIMPISDLLGLLDSDAYDRAVVALGVLPEQSNIQIAMTSLSSAVYSIYQIMDKSFQDISGKNITDNLFELS